MKKIKALTLIEVLFVVVVIALILLAGAGQLQRYRQARDIQMAKTAIESLSNYAMEVYAEQCPTILASSTTYLLICPNSMQKAENAGVNTGCNTKFAIVNPFYLHSSLAAADGNYQIMISFDPKQGIPVIRIDLPISGDYVNFTSTPSLSGNVMLQKLIAALEPTSVSTNIGGTQLYYPTNTQSGWSADKCPSILSDAICFSWYIQPNNWGTLSTASSNNQMINNEEANFATQYFPNSDEWQTIKSNPGKPQLQCPALEAGAIHKTK